MKKRMMTQKEYGRPAMKVVELRHAGMLMAVARRTMAGAMMAATLMLGMTACSSEDGLAEEPQQPAQPAQTPQQTYTLTVTASKGDDSALAQALAKAGLADGPTTRALTLSSDGKTLNAAWAAGEKVYVYNDTKNVALGGYLEAKTDGANVTLEGELTGTVEKGDELYLAFPQLNEDYRGQDGTLTKIASTYDYALGWAKVTDVSDGKITVEDNYYYGGTTIRLDNQQAIVKFTLWNKADDNQPINATSLTIDARKDSKAKLIQTLDFAATTATHGPITITPSATNVIYAALGTSSVGSYDYTLIATDENGNMYTYTKTDVEFELGEYYEITVKMEMEKDQTINLSTLSGNYVAQDGDVLIGALNGETQPYKISIAAGTTVTLKGVTINGVNNNSCKWAGITCLGDATIILKDGTTNTVRGFHEDYPGIYVPFGSTLTIGGTGALTAESYVEGKKKHGIGCGIGGGRGLNSGNIVINSGTITATGHGESAGIGGGSYGDEGGVTAGTITINGGTVTAKGGSSAAGIGSGSGCSCGDISITGGTVTAKGGSSAAGIGTGYDGTCGTISINLSSGTVTAQGGKNAAGIGTGYYGTCGSITVANGTVTADRGQYADYDIGLGDNGHFSNNGSVTIGDDVHTSDGKSYSSGSLDKGYNHE